VKNKKVKQMICSIYKSKMEKSHFGIYDFAYVNGELGFWVNRVGPITMVKKNGAIYADAAFHNRSE